jgi:hypothetical protein
MIDSRTLEHVPEKLIDFSDENMLQLFDFEHLLLARVIQPEPKMLESIISRKTAGAVPSSPLAESCLSCRILLVLPNLAWRTGAAIPVGKNRLSNDEIRQIIEASNYLLHGGVGSSLRLVISPASTKSP